MQYIFNRLHYLHCKKEKHYQQQLSLVCSDPLCQKREPLCCFCLELDHSGHQTQHLSQFLFRLFNQTSSIAGYNAQPKHNNSSQNNSQPALNGLYYIKKVQKMLNQYMKIIDLKRQSMLEELEQLQILGKNYFNSIGGMCIQILTSQEKIINLMKKSKQKVSGADKRLENHFKKLLRQMNFQHDGSFSIQVQLNKLLSFGQEVNKKLESQLKKLLTNFSEMHQRITKDLSTDYFYQNYKQVFKWSEDLKPKNKTISDEQLVITQVSNDYSNQRFAMIDFNLSQMSRKMKTSITWAYKVIKCSSWIGVGICLKQSIINLKYQFNYSNIGHGSYLLSSNGYTWSHSDKNYNSVYKGFSYGINDIIEMTYDQDASIVKFTKYSKVQNSYVISNEYSLMISKTEQLNPYYPCVNLCSVGDKIEIVSQYK